MDLSGSETTYRFGGDATALIAELARIRAELDKNAAKAQDTGKAVNDSLKPPAEGEKFVSQLQKQAAELGKTKGELLSQKAAALGVTDQTKNLISQISEASKAQHKFGFETAQSKRELLVLAHELSQGNYKRFGGSLLVLAEQTGAASLLFSAMGVAVLGTVGALGLFGLAAIKGAIEDKQLNDSLKLTGNYAGLTVDQFRSMNVAIAAVSGQPIGAVREAMQELISTGRFSGPVLAGVTKAVVDLERVSGQSSADIVKDFAKMSDGVAKWAAEHNKQYHYLTAAEYDYIRALEAQGKTQEAIAFSAGKLDDSLKKHTDNLGLLEKAWKGVKGAASGAWESMLNLGRQDSIADRIKSATDTLGYYQKNLAAQQSKGAGNAPQIELAQSAVDRQNSLIEGLRREASAKNAAAEQEGKDAEKNERDILERSAQFQSARISLAAAADRKIFTAGKAEAEELQASLERNYAKGDLDLAGFVALEYARRRDLIRSEITLIENEKRAEFSKQPGSEIEQLQADQKRIELNTRLIELRKKQRDLDGARLRDEIQPKELKNFNVDTPAQNFSKFEHAHAAETEKTIAQMREAQLKSADDLVQLNRETTDKLIKDERQRGLELIALEEEKWRKKLDIAGQGAEEQKRLEGELATWRANKEQELTEKLKPQWAKQLDEWRNHNRLMRDSFNEFQTGWLQTGENAWVEFIKTGKLNLKSFADFALEQFAKVQFKDAIAPAFSKLGGVVAGLFGIKSPDSIGGTGGQGANTSALQGSTVSLGSFTAALDAARATLLNQSDGGTGGIGGWLGGLFGKGGGSGTGVGGAEGSSFNVDYKYGGAFAGGAHAFAKGGAFTNRVFNTPTPFRFARGGAMHAGVMGEAGDEAIMPLKRGPGGSLGVAAHGAGGRAPTVIINAPPGTKVDRTETRDGPSGPEIEAWLSMAENHIAGRMAQGRGPVVGALQKRGVSTDKNLSRVG